MKFKLYELENRILKLNALGAKKLPVKLSYAISKNSKLFLAEYETVTKERQKVLERDCLRNDDGSPVITDNSYTYENEDTKRTAIDEVTELLQTETDIEVMKVPIAVLEKCDDLQKFDALTAEEVAAIDFMLE